MSSDFLRTTFYMVCSPDESMSPALTKAQGKEEYCVTISPIESKVTFNNWATKKVTGQQLISSIPENIAILVSYEDGGSYLSPQAIQELKSTI